MQASSCIIIRNRPSTYTPTPSYQDTLSLWFDLHKYKDVEYTFKKEWNFYLFASLAML